MKHLHYLLFFSLVSIAEIFPNGIGIIDGSKGIYMQVLESSTSVYVKDQIAIITVTQIFKNNTSEDINFKYGFPLNENANPTNLRWKYNNVWNDAVVNSLPQDNSIPGGTGGGGGSGSQNDLLNYLGEHPLFFSPKDTISVDSNITLELTYVELLPYFQGKVSFSQKNNISRLQSETINSQSLYFSLESEKKLLSIELFDLMFDVQEFNNTTVLNFNTEEAVGDFDYNLEYQLSSEALGINSLSSTIADSLFSCDTLGDGYFAFIIEPESNIDTEVIEKNFSLIIDRSGSMSGDKIVQAKDAASYIIQNLNLGDFFNIIDFSSSVKSFSSGLVEYNASTESAALAYIDNITASGSTNISESLLTSINQFSVVEEDKANIIIFCTDGNATSGVTSTNGIIELIEDEVISTEKNVFLFTIGIGEDLDQALLTLLARENNGLVQFIDPNHLEDDLVKFFLSINNPVLLNTSITISPDIINEIYPFPYPNLYKGQQLILTGRYESADDLEITLEGKAFNVPVYYNFQVSLSDTTNNNLSFLPKIWAKQKLDVLSIDYYLAENTTEQDSISKLIDSLSICYGVIAVEFSSYEDLTETDELTDHNSDSKILVYPNPFVDQVTIEIKSLKHISKPVELKLYDLQAQLLYHQTHFIKDGKILIDGLEILERGVYFAIFEINNKMYIVKLLK